MICGFWGLQILPKKAYTQTVDASFRVCMAALGEEITKQERTVVKVTVDQKTFVLCSLTPGSVEQQQLELIFTEGEEITFFVTGENPVYLTGNYLPDDEMDSAYGSDEDEDDEDANLDLEELAAKYNVDVNELIEELSRQNSDGDESSDDDEASSGKIQLLKDGEDLDDESEEGDEDFDEGMEVEEDDEEEEVDEEAEEALRDEVKAMLAEAKQDVKKSTKASESDKKRKAADDSQDKATTTPKKVKDNKAAAEPAKSPKSQEKAKQTNKFVKNGVTIEDFKVGTGAESKKGHRVSMRYVGKLTSGKVFDQNTKGKPFKFRLGGGEVIQGWDIGIAGMKVGGERRLTIPANLAYGRRGAPPDIPGNATLVFDVKLLDTRGK
ncbi:peptidylprolyl isomerase fpr3 [Dimargaris xerosporica]|nr:peptidylprolyl isomerase fpr3 [Dimargaris xerosporica]